jgi:hypothetical protein
MLNKVRQVKIVAKVFESVTQLKLRLTSFTHSGGEK